MGGDLGDVHRGELSGALEDAIFLRGELPLAALDEDELDRIVGSIYAYVEQCFRGLLRLGFASRFA